MIIRMHHHRQRRRTAITARTARARLKARSALAVAFDRADFWQISAFLTRYGPENADFWQISALLMLFASESADFRWFFAQNASDGCKNADSAEKSALSHPRF